MHRVPPEVSEKIFVLLEHCNCHARTSQQIAEHHSGGSATNHAAGCPKFSIDMARKQLPTSWLRLHIDCLSVSHGQLQFSFRQDSSHALERFEVTINTG
jgi:hypothetical protein